MQRERERARERKQATGSSVHLVSVERIFTYFLFFNLSKTFSHTVKGAGRGEQSLNLSQKKKIKQILPFEKKR